MISSKADLNDLNKTHSCNMFHLLFYCTQKKDIVTGCIQGLMNSVIPPEERLLFILIKVQEK